jgi:hypothetical protein
MKQYFQNVAGYLLEPGGHIEQWIGTFVHGEVI